MADQATWADGFDVPFIQEEWRQLRAGSASKRAEVLLQRVIWRGLFSDYLAELNGEEPRVRFTARTAGRRSDLTVRKFTARALRKAGRAGGPA